MKVTSHEYELTLERRTSYLYVKLTARVVSADMLRHLLSISAPHYREAHVSRVLIERDIAVPLSNEKARSVIDTVNSLLPPGLSVGYIEKDPDNREALQHAIAAVDPPRIEFAVFSTVDEAEQWSACNR